MSTLGDSSYSTFIQVSKIENGLENASELIPLNSTETSQINDQKKCTTTWNFEGFCTPLNYILEILVRTGRNDAHSLHELDGMRALSFLWVYTSHCALYNSTYISENAFIEFPNSYMRNLAEVGYQGVTCFFVLSGFLIPMVLVSRFKKMNGNNSFNLKYAELFVNFILKRFLRIAPSLWVTMIIAMLYGKFSADSKAREYLYSVCSANFWTNFVFCSNFYGACIGGFWSVSVEMQLYVFSAIPVYFYLIKPSYGWIAVILWIIAVFIARFVVLAYILSLNIYDDGGYTTIYYKYVYKNTFLRADAYAMGMGTFMLWEWLKTQKNCDITPLGTSTPLKLTIIFFTSAFVIITPFFVNSCSPVVWLELTDGGSSQSNTTPSYLYYACLADFVVALDASAILLMVITTGKHHAKYIDINRREEPFFANFAERMGFFLKYCYCTFCWFMSRLLSSSFLFPVASLSYTGYLMTEPSMRIYLDTILYKWVDGDTLKSHTLLAIIVYTLEFFFLMSLSFLLSLFVERPFMRLSNRIKVTI